MLEDTKKSLDTKPYYQYNVKCREKTVVLDIEDTDLIYNADGEVDCPLDLVLRKNCYSFQDLMDWESQTVHFVEIDGDCEKILKRITLSVNL